METINAPQHELYAHPDHMELLPRLRNGDTLYNLPIHRELEGFYTSIQGEKKRQRAELPKEERNQHAWFTLPDDASPTFREKIDKAHKFATMLSQDQDQYEYQPVYDKTTEALQALDDGIEDDPFVAYSLARALSLEAEHDRLQHNSRDVQKRPVFQAVADYVAILSERGLYTQEDQSDWLCLGQALSICSARLGSACFISGLARSDLTDKQYAKDFIGKNHGQFYTPEEFLKSINDAYDHTIQPHERETERKRLRDLFSTTLAPGKIWTPSHLELYNWIDLSYSHGDRMIKTDMEVFFNFLRSAGLEQESLNNMCLLDMVAGQGRHVVQLKEYFRHVLASDGSVHYAKTIDPDVATVAADWTQYPFQDSIADVAINIGRNTAGQKTNERQKGFEEAHRLLKEGGLYLMDHPYILDGKYQKVVDESRELFKGFRPGDEGAFVIVDGPDEIHRTCRVFASLEQLLKEAQRAGFEPVNMYVRPIPDTEDTEGAVGMNVYLGFRKR